MKVMIDGPEAQAQVKRLFIVVRRRDNQIVAYCNEVEDAARVIVRQSRREDCYLREADVTIGEVVEKADLRPQEKILR